MLNLVITDDGRGVDLDRVNYREKHGIQGMQEYAAVVGGIMTVESQPGHGMIMRFSLEAPGD